MMNKLEKYFGTLKFVISSLLAIATTFVLIKIIAWIKNAQPEWEYTDFFEYLRYVLTIESIAGSILILFIFYSFIFTMIYDKFKINKIRKAVDKLVKENFDEELNINRNQIITYINKMNKELSVLIDKENSAISLKNELVSNVSHDLRTPLTSIIGYMRLIHDNRYKDEVELMYYIDIAYEKSLRLNRMVNDLFEFSKLSNDDIKLQYTTFNLIELFQQLAAEYSLPLRRENMELEIDYQEKEMLITADPDKLMRVFENLISNAIKYGKEGHKIDVIIEKEAEHCTVKVKNYGEKIPSYALPYIFDRLFRVEESRSDKTGGSGLGLAIAKEIVNLHNGEIMVFSDDAETVFQVRLPLKEVVG
ncbi:sensor histidine kinase [Chengkuizengella axinellae]|uniref:histidine kinase n=1 Tax=Chengkuizengella axinellae TaxID=3064388 RepID=A0ABT9J092_9BACL|nr:HAMP domain-containing sensor histidine kinase [Chengkuizengella sp. 2205SS18-9]MDP5275033.1 HAMP domain-containing sensor histidine kinase [Chengkuizengella sp. 2205SS18-9]